MRRAERALARFRDGEVTGRTFGYIARALDTTPLVLRRRFRRAMGCPPSVWWRRQRLARAAELLAADLKRCLIQIGCPSWAELDRRWLWS